MKKNTRKLLSVGLLIPVLFLAVLFTLSYLHVRREQWNNALIAAVKRQDVRAVSRLLDEGADPNTKDIPYVSPTNLLDWLKAAFHGRAHPTDGYTDNALILAVSNEDPPTVKTLLDHGADPDARGKDGFTGLMLTSDALNSEVLIRLLLSAHADINARNLNGDTVLCFACLVYHTDDVKLLLQKGANPNVQTESGMTALMLAISRGNFDIVPILLAYHADVNLKDRAGHTALWQAKHEGETHNKDLTHDDWVDIAERLEEAGAK
jgi:ankyrin repeat protein